MMYLIILVILLMCAALLFIGSRVDEMWHKRIPRLEKEDALMWSKLGDNARTLHADYRNLFSRLTKLEYPKKESRITTDGKTFRIEMRHSEGRVPYWLGTGEVFDTYSEALNALVLRNAAKASESTWKEVNI